MILSFRLHFVNAKYFFKTLSKFRSWPQIQRKSTHFYRYLHTKQFLNPCCRIQPKLRLALKLNSNHLHALPNVCHLGTEINQKCFGNRKRYHRLKFTSSRAHLCAIFSCWCLFRLLKRWMSSVPWITDVRQCTLMYWIQFELQFQPYATVRFN